MPPPRPPLEEWLARRFVADEDAGWVPGTLSVFLGSLSLTGVVAFWFPGVLSTEEFRAQYPLPLLRGLLELAIGIGFLLGTASLLVRRSKALGVTGITLALAATLAGGGSVPIESDFDQKYTIGVDWFVLNLFVTALLFVPLERLFPRLPEQLTFRFGWTTDGMHFLVSHLAVQALTFLTLLPATTLAEVWQPAALRAAIRAQPVWLQVAEIVLLADLGQYWVHRAFHRVPLLWRFHAIHHSSRAIDWLAGSRLHVVDVLATRGLVLVPVFLLGFAGAALYAYILLVSFHAVLIHANLRFRFGRLDRFVVTPRVHHWHHAMTPVDKNFAVHLPVLDWLFGTQYLPGDAWPEAYGIGHHPMPEGWARQFLYAFRFRSP